MTYAKALKEYEEKAEKGEKFGPLPCGICRTLTPRLTLMERGAMCQSCYDAYLEGARQNRIGLKANEGRKA